MLKIRKKCHFEKCGRFTQLYKDLVTLLWRESRVHWHLEASGRLRFIKQNLKVVDPCCCYSILLYVPSTIYDFVCSKYLVWKLTKTRAKGKWANKKFDFKVQSKPTGSHWAEISFIFRDHFQQKYRLTLLGLAVNALCGLDRIYLEVGFYDLRAFARN